MSSYGKDPSGPCTCPAPCTVERHQNQDFHDEGNATKPPEQRRWLDALRQRHGEGIDNPRTV